MVHKIKIKGTEHEMLLGYTTLKSINRLATSRNQEALDFEDFEKLALEGIQMAAKVKQEISTVTLEDIQEAFEADIDLAMEVQVWIEGFILPHLQKRQKLSEEYQKKMKK